MRAGRIVSIALIVFLVVIVNAPYLYGRTTDWRLEHQGRDVTVAVTDHAVVEGSYVLQLTDERVDRAGPVAVEVSRSAYDEAVAAGSTTARVLDGDTGHYEVRGQVRSRVPLFFTLFADVAILACVVLFTRFRVAMRPELVLRATADLEPCEPGSVLDRIVGNEYVVAGEVHEVDGDEVLLDLGDRKVRVVLDGHANPAGPHEPVRVVGVMIA